MKKKLLTLLTIILSFNCYSQISYEKGYFIDNNNQKTNCLIKNIDWKNNPTEFKYKLTENSETKKATIKSIKEYGIDNISKYIRSTVNIDKSSEHINDLSNNKNPIFKEEELFLKVLVDGKATLYQYVDNNVNKYFYNKENSKIEQLIFKSYKTTENNIGKNNRFRQQLWIDLKCPNLKKSNIKNVKYQKNDLILFFIAYNKCYNNEFINFEPKQKRKLFNLTIRPRINSSNLTLQNSYSNTRDTDFDNKTGFGFGLEAEFIFPFNKNKWAFAIEPTYQSFKSKKSTNVNSISGGILIVNVDYRSIEIPLTLRHYFFLNNNSKIFINASFITDFNSKSTIEFSRNDGSHLSSLEVGSKDNRAMGIGYKQNDRYSLEIRYQTNREIIKENSPWTSDYKTLSIIFGYSLF